MLKEGLDMLGRSGAARTLVTRTPLRAMSRRFVPGERIEDLLEALREANAQGLSATANYLGEAVRDERTAREASGVYRTLLGCIRDEGLDANVSVKFTQLGQDISDLVLAPNLAALLQKADETDTFVRFDMESSAHTEPTLDAFERLWAEGWRNIGVVLQAYLHRSEGDVARMIELGARVRLCKGAYVEPESIAFQGDAAVRGNFVRLMRRLLDSGTYPAIATHDERMIEATLEHAAMQGIRPDRFELQMLYGVRRDLQRELVESGYNVRVYVPFGEQWYPYLMRRLAERPSNVLLIAGSVVRESPFGALLPGRRRGNGWGRRGAGRPGRGHAEGARENGGHGRSDGVPER
jgi:proline dehydrogenase